MNHDADLVVGEKPRPKFFLESVVIESSVAAGDQMAGKGER